MKNIESKTLQFKYDNQEYEAEVEIYLYHEWNNEFRHFDTFIEDIVIISIYNLEMFNEINFESAPQDLIELIKIKAENSLEEVN